MRDYDAVVNLLLPVLQSGKSLDPGREPGATPLAREIAFGVLRHYFRVSAIVDRLVKKPLPDKHLDLRILLMAGIYSIDGIRRPAYASVNEAVDCAQTLGKEWAKGMVNGVLRNYIRNRDEIDRAVATNPEAVTEHPRWLQQQIEQAWPEVANDILMANNTQAPMTLRVNLSRGDLSSYRDALEAVGIQSHPGKLSPSALYLEKPVNVEQLPDFDLGAASVQDEASQLAAPLLDVHPGMRVLDACAAPGGKTCHILEITPDVELVAMDVDPNRLRQVRQNISRLGLSCQLVASDLVTWSDAQGFDRILLDAPCSATGIIRRHPDIKLLRRESDIAKLVGAQAELLAAAWRLLKPGGVLVYSTCSILPAENDEVVAGFIEQQGDASLLAIDADWGVSTGTGRQLFPMAGGHDGFFYARLEKRP